MNAPTLRGFAVSATATLVTVVSAQAQAILHPNQIVGTISQPTTNPVIAARLALPGPPSTSVFWTIDARSTSPPLSHRVTAETAVRGSGSDYDLTVEASDVGIGYELLVRSSRSNDNGADYYVFARVNSAPVRVEPAADVRQDVSECPGAVRFRWVDVTGAPALVTSGEVRALRVAPTGSNAPYIAQATDIVAPGSSEIVFIVRGDGEPFLLQVDYTLGSDPFSDLVRYRYEATVSVGCDEVYDIQHQAGNCSGNCPCVPLELGSIAGNFDVVGEEEHHLSGTPTSLWYAKTLVRALQGPWENERYDLLDTTPSSGSFFLANLVPSEVELVPKTYAVTALAALRRGDRYQTLETPPVDVVVGCGENVDLGDTLVMNPAFVSGSIVLAGPPPRPAPQGSPLDGLRRAQDPAWDIDLDGIPDQDGSGPVFSQLSHVEALPYAPRGGTQATFGGAMAADGATFLGDYEMVLASPGNAARPWHVGTLKLVTQDGTNPPDPMSYMSATTRIQDSRGMNVAVAPGDRVARDHHYCLSRVDIGFHATSGTFYFPMIFASGRMTGIDFEGLIRDYSVDGSGQGLPHALADATNTASVTVLLPAGDYSLEPHVRAVSPSGSVSFTELLPLALNVGCRQDISLLPDLVVQVDQVGPCADAGWIVVTGRVTGGSDIARVEWSVNGTAPTTACSPCGIDPHFSLDVPVDLVPNEIFVRAVTVDRRIATAVSHTQPAREPSALDLRPGVEPLRVSKADTGRLHLTWEIVPGAEADVFRGTIDAFRNGGYDHAPFGACGIASGETEIDSPSPNAYFVVAGGCGWGNGSCGRSSFGRERSVARGTCP